MAFRQHHRPQPSRQLSFHSPEPVAEVEPASSPLRKRALDESEEWVLFSPTAPSATARTTTTSTERTPRTAGLSRLSDFGSLDTRARSDQEYEDDDLNSQGLETEEGGELDSLDDGLHAFHEPSEYGAPLRALQQSGDTVLPTHDGLGTFQPDGGLQDQLWQFERQPSRRRPHARRRSSVQRRLDALEETDEVVQDLDRRQRIEHWRLEQSRALLEEIEKETRRRRRQSMVSAARSRSDSVQQERQLASVASVAQDVSDGQSVSSDDKEQLSFWQRLTRRVIRDLFAIDDDTLSVIFGESLPEEAQTPLSSTPKGKIHVDDTVQSLEISSFPGEPWEHRLLERIARELGILVNQITDHPGAFSTYQATQEAPEYAGMSTKPAPATLANSKSAGTTLPSSSSGPHFTPTYTTQQPSNTYSEASLWGIEEEPDIDPLDSFRNPQASPPVNTAEELVREQEYWERELDVKMVFNFLVRRFSGRRYSNSSQHRRSLSAPGQPRAPSTTATNTEAVSARRAAIIRQHHPLVSRNAERALPSSSLAREGRRKEVIYRTHFNPASLRNPVLRSSSSCASHSTKKSKRSANYWDIGGSVGSGSVIAGEA
ncbi:hypothetical protein P154DRAFT_196206 [Amniculicola lignicola CBS 123094]|uniref:Uncharacterized protein n=1 Tax=Amniculicola lignicola CBS 123094 TaxID=1392246 RepID=A0A6A5WF47_9PLEO|nr:hypothetical protein P154DRAFT_196206 [Amniculicola lignicola CBS 123094]